MHPFPNIKKIAAPGVWLFIIVDSRWMSLSLCTQSLSLLSVCSPLASYPFFLPPAPGNAHICSCRNAPCLMRPAAPSSTGGGNKDESSLTTAVSFWLFVPSWPNQQMHPWYYYGADTCYSSSVVCASACMPARNQERRVSS